MSKTSQREQSYFDLGRKLAKTHTQEPRKSRWRFKREYNLGWMLGKKEAENRECLNRSAPMTFLHNHGDGHE